MLALGIASACFVPVHAALLDVWRAEDLAQLNDGDTVGTWTSASNRVASANAGDQPVFKRAVTPGGTDVVRFNRSFMTVPSNPCGSRTAFSLVIVFKADAAGANDAANWYGKSGIVDAEEPGVTLDWGTVIDQNGQVGIGTGSPDQTIYTTGTSLVDGQYHVAVFTWGSGSQAVYLDDRAPLSLSGVTSGARDNVNIAFGGIRTGEGGTNRRFVGDLAEIRFYDTALSGLEASNVIADLRDTHVYGTLPRILSFTSRYEPNLSRRLCDSLLECHERHPPHHRSRYRPSRCDGYFGRSSHGHDHLYASSQQCAGEPLRHSDHLSRSGHSGGQESLDQYPAKRALVHRS